VLIVGKNLDGLVRRFEICPLDLVDQFSIKLKIDNQVRRMKAAQGKLETVTYAKGMNAAILFEDLEDSGHSIELSPNDKILACSDVKYKMPPGYFGLIQTKGTLARLFVSCTCNDGQVEPGYHGRITLEISNQSNYNVILPVGSEVAQIFLFKCSGDADSLYAGKYQGAIEPTLPIFNASSAN
jgi:dCTP deaminase